MHECSSHGFCIEDAIRKAEIICRDKSLRFTKLRRKVLEMIWANHGPSKAYDILDKLKGKDGSAKPPTVYRTLDFLMENGLVHRLSSINAYVGCSHPLEHNECYFLICNDCNEIKECCNTELADVIKHTGSKNNFEPKEIILEIAGKCQECLKH